MARRTVGEHFDEWASRYDAEIHAHVPRYDEIQDTVVQLLTVRPPHRVLDLGTGTGVTALRLLEALPEARVVGIDVSSEMLTRARQRLRVHRRRVELRAGDIATPELDGLFDAIVSVLAVHHLWADEKRHLFSRLWEHLAPGGILVVADAFRHASDRLAELYGYPRPEDPHEAEHDHLDTTADHLDWLQAAGFATVDVVWKYEDVGVLVAWKADRR
ncbi:MAG TPA: class I SAM-dependent methyltransferase [candidate division Zixibacteria bacterium]|nr:class I SAM-dependent methyltransferase [candidate division Zixibacteria bacterium]